MGVAAVTVLDALLLMLATWRISHALASEKGPWGFLERLRGRFHGVLDCVYCASVWVAGVVTGPYVIIGKMPLWQWPVWIFAVSGGALMLRSYTGVLHDR
jgi:hypothetical protein